MKYISLIATIVATIGGCFAFKDGDIPLVVINFSLALANAGFLFHWVKADQ
jgi:hypothetical protein